MSAQFDYTGGAGPGACLDIKGRPRIRFFALPFTQMGGRPEPAPSGAARATYGQATDICFNDFGPRPLHVTVVGPDGRKSTGTLPGVPAGAPGDQTSPGTDWVPAFDPDWPLGRYTIDARSRDAHVTAAFVLHAPTRPGLRVLGPSTDPGHNEIVAGRPADIYLVGFRGIRSVRLDVYRSGPGFPQAIPYFGSELVRLPRGGNVVLHAATARADLGRTFVVMARVPDGGRVFGSFTLMARRFAGGAVVGRLPTAAPARR